MFVEEEFEWTVQVRPDAMKSPLHIQRAVILELMKKFDDLKCTPMGYFVALETIESIGEGRIMERRGCAAFPVRFRCLMFTLVKREFVFAIVVDVNPTGICCSCGPVERLWVAEDHLKGKDPDNPAYSFVGSDSSTQGYAHWLKSGTKMEIKKGDVVRVKILGTQYQSAGQKLQREIGEDQVDEGPLRSVVAMGTMLDHYAGIDIRFRDVAATSCGKGIAANDGDGANAGNDWVDDANGMAEDDELGAWG